MSTEHADPRNALPETDDADTYVRDLAYLALQGADLAVRAIPPGHDDAKDAASVLEQETLEQVRRIFHEEDAEAIRVAALDAVGERVNGAGAPDPDDLYHVAGVATMALGLASDGELGRGRGHDFTDREALEILSGHLDPVLQEIITARGRDVEEETRRLLTTLHDILAAAAGPAAASTEAEPSVAPIPSDAESRIHDVIQRLRVLHRALYREIQGIKEQEEGGAELWGALVALDWTVDRLEAAVEAVYADGDLLRLESALMEASNLLAAAAEVLYQRSDALTEGTGLHHLVQDAAEALVALWEEYAGAWPEPAA